MKLQLRFILLVAALFCCLAPSQAQDLKGRKVLYINSFHKGYDWSDGIQSAIEKTLLPEGVDLKVIMMDTLRSNTLQHLIEVSAECKQLINDWKPEVVILSDDPAVKGVYNEHFNHDRLPFVFCGINWNMNEYPYHTNNVTGMLEVCDVKKLADEMSALKPGKSYGYLSANARLARQDKTECEKILGVKFETVLAGNFEEWKRGFLKLQTNVDFLIIGSNQAIRDWNETEARQFVEANARVISGANHDYLNGVSLISINKLPAEQGEYAAKTAIQILKGATPASFPIVANQKSERVINPRIAKKLGLTIPSETLKNSRILE